MSTRRQGIVNHYVRGTDTLAHSLQMLLTSVAFSLLLASAIGLSLSVWNWYQDTTPYTRAWAWSLVQAEVWDGLGYPHHLVSFPSDEKLTAAKLPAGEIVGSPNIQEFEDGIQKVAISALWRGAKVTFAIFFVLLGLGIYRGWKAGQDQKLRGGDLQPAPKVARLVRKAGASEISLGEVPLPAGAETQHLLITGRPGVGKSVLISSVLDSVRDRGDRAVIYDPAGEFTRHFYQPGDVILNPADSRCPGWTPWDECVSTTDYYRLASSIIPQSSNDPYWSDAARSLFSSALLSLAEAGRKDLRELLRLCLAADLSELAIAVAGTEAESLLSEENAKMALSVRATMTAYLRSLLLLPSNSKERFSMREWTQEGKGWVFIPVQSTQLDSLRSLISTWMDSAVSSMLSLPPDRERRVWMILDELPSLQKLPSLMPGMAQGRKHGLCVVNGIQSVAQLRQIYGRDEAEALFGLPGTQCHFSAGDPETSEWVSKSLMAQEVSEVSEDMTYSASDIKDSVRLSDRRTERKLVLPSEIMALEKLNFYLRLPDGFPVCKSRVKIKVRPSRTEPFQASNGQTIGDELRRLRLSSPGYPEGGGAEPHPKPKDQKRVQPPVPPLDLV